LLVWHTVTVKQMQVVPQYLSKYGMQPYLRIKRKRVP